MKQKIRDRVKAVRSIYKKRPDFYELLKQQYKLEKNMIVDIQAAFNNVNFNCFTVKQASALFSPKTVKFSPVDSTNGIKTKDGYNVEFALNSDSAMGTQLTG